MTVDRLQPELDGKIRPGQASGAQILVISQFFGPDSSAVGQLLADAAEELSRAGHKISVICGVSDYVARDRGQGRNTGRGNAPGAQRNGSQPGPGVIEVNPVKNLPFSHSKVKKLLSYATFYAGATWKALQAPRPEVVVTLTAPPGLAWIGWLMQRMRGCRHVAWEMDVYPDIAMALDMPLIGRLGGILDYPRRRADVVIALGECMKTRLLRHRIPQQRILVAENWANGRKIYPLPFPLHSPLRILYSGNLGLAHDVTTIRGVIEHFAGTPKLHFAFVGGGSGRQDLQQHFRRQAITNVSFATYVQLERLGESLAGCHIGLVTQKPSTLGAVVPSKIYGLMAAGRPVLYIGPGTATPALVVRRFDCGWHFECDDVEGVSGLLSHLLAHPGDVRQKGKHGREAFEEHYDTRAGVARICNALGVRTSDHPARKVAADES
jgi:colanic acid biosynthesis glycosyl transferase WcaI